MPAAVQSGKSFRVRGRVTNLPKSRKKSARLVFTLRKSGRFIHLRTVKVKRTKKSRSRSFSVRISMPDIARAGSYTLRACVRKSCRSKRLRVTDKPVPTPGPGPTPPGPPSALPAQHSLRAPLTGENFYFVMADRFFNGDTANDKGGIASDDPEVHGFDPTRKGYFHGGDLAGLRQKIDYIKGLGTTAIWLTPSFKNRAVQDNNGFPSAGYHGYWVTDFTQIDPHFGTNAEFEGADRRGAREGDEGLLRHHHQPHRGRHPVRGDTTTRTSRRTSIRSRRPRARRSTTATTPGAPSRRSAGRRASPTRPSTRRT